MPQEHGHTAAFSSQLILNGLRGREQRAIVILNYSKHCFFQHKIFCIIPARSCVLVLLTEKNKEFPSRIFVWSANEEKVRLTET